MAVQFIPRIDDTGTGAYTVFSSERVLALVASVSGGGSGPVSIADVTGLQTALDGKSDTDHSHLISDVTDLQTALDAKATLTHTHTISQVTNLQAMLDGKASLAHTHAIADVIGLQTLLDGKASASHSHPTSEVTGLDTALAGKADASHTHDAGDITTGTLAADRVPALTLAKITDAGGLASLDAVDTAQVSNGAVTADKLADVPALTPGQYTNATVTVDQKGRVTAIETGTGSSDPDPLGVNEFLVVGLNGKAMFGRDGTPVYQKPNP